MEYIKGADNEIADWLSRSALLSNHEETPLADEFVINEIADWVVENSFDTKRNSRIFRGSFRNMIERKVIKENTESISGNE